MWALYLSMHMTLLNDVLMPEPGQDTGRRFVSAEACAAAAKRETREHFAVTNTGTCIKLPENWL